MQILHCPTAVVKRKASCSFRFKLFPHGDVSLVILLFPFPSFPPRGLPCPASRRRLPSPSPPPPESALSLSPSFQVIDVLSLRRIHQHGGGILRRSEEASQEGLANNSALSSFLSGVADVLSSPFLPSFLPSGLRSHLQIWREGATAYMVPLIAKCGIIQVGPSQRVRSSDPYLVSFGRPHNCMHAFSHAFSFT